MNWSDRIPREYKANLRYRLKLLRACRKESYQRAVIEACRQDICFFISTFIFQHNGKESLDKKVGPFIAWDFQEVAVREMVACVMEGRDLVIEKSRDMGASWLCLIVCLWLWLFHDWQTILIMSKSANAVDDETPESLFWKLDFMIDHLPGWLQQGYIPKKHRRAMSLRHPNGSTIYGSASTGKAGVGGKCALMFVDEFSQIEEGYEVLHRTTDTTDCRIFNGTHLGMGTAFYELTDPQSAAGSFIKKLVMHWTQHPEKRRGLYQFNEAINRVEVLDKQFDFPADYKFVLSPSPAGGPHPGLRSPWYDDQCGRKGNSRAVAMDLDIDPSGSVKQFFNAILIRHLIASFCTEPWWEADFVFDEEIGRPIRMEKRLGGKCKLWCRFPNDRPPLGTYAIGTDASQGTGATASCITVCNAETGDKVLEFSDATIDPKTLGSMLVALGWLFKDRMDRGARLVWETPGPGVTVGGRIAELHYGNIFGRPDKFKKDQMLPGWAQNPTSKLRLLNEYHDALRTRKFLNPSREALLECLKFMFTDNGSVEHSQEKSHNDPSGARVNHGDHVIADALAWWVAKESWLPKEKEETEPAYDHLSVEGRRRIRERSEKESWA